MAKTIADLKQDTSNPRKHNARNLQVIVDSLQDVGFARSIVIDENDEILAGNGVTEAAALAGIDKVVEVEADGNTIIAVRRRGLTDEQKQRLKYFDNRSGELAEWNAEQLLADIGAGVDLSALFRDDELDALLADLQPKPEVNDTGPQLDRAEELRQKWGVNSGDLWQLGEHRLICGDCTDAEVVARVLQGEIPLLMVTDPPYGVEYDPNWRNEAAAAGHLAYAASRVGKVENDDRVDWSDAYNLFPGDVAYTWSPGGDHVILTGSVLQACGFQIRNQIMWRKSNFPISRGHYTYQHEPCWYAVKKGRTAHWIGDANASTVWEINLDRNVAGGHSTQKPLECMARPIRNHEGDVYDPFAGSGTTGIACQNLGRRAYMVEIAPKYCAVILERFNQIGVTPKLIEHAPSNHIGSRVAVGAEGNEVG